MQSRIEIDGTIWCIEILHDAARGVWFAAVGRGWEPTRWLDAEDEVGLCEILLLGGDGAAGAGSVSENASVPSTGGHLIERRFMAPNEVEARRAWKAAVRGLGLVTGRDTRAEVVADRGAFLIE